MFLKRNIIGWLKIAVFLFDDVIALVLIILILQFFKIDIPIVMIIILAIPIGTLLFIIHKTIIPDFQRKPITGQEGMIGQQGIVVKTLAPNGSIVFDGEHWRAISVNGDIEINESVEIVGVDGLTLQVKHRIR